MSHNKTLNDAQRKLEIGDPLTDEDLKLLKKYYQSLNDTLGTCFMPQYKLFITDVWTRLCSIDGYIAARKEKSGRVYSSSMDADTNEC